MQYYKNIYIHDENIIYPHVDNQHMVIAPHKHDYIYDKNFEYRMRGFKHILIRKLIRIAMFLVAFPVARVRYALKIEGRKNIKQYYALTKGKGMISVCNHTTDWDYLLVLLTRCKFNEMPIWQEGAEGPSGMLYREVGGIPMPKHDLKGMGYSFEHLKEVVKEEKWLHVYPEAACWPFYPAIRNFELGTFRIAYDTNKPVLPMAVTYRPAKGLYKLFKKHPNATIRIGKPQCIDYSLPKSEAISDLRDRIQLEVMKLANINSVEENNEIRNYIYGIQENKEVSTKIRK